MSRRLQKQKLQKYLDALGNSSYDNSVYVFCIELISCFLETVNKQIRWDNSRHYFTMFNYVCVSLWDYELLFDQNVLNIIYLHWIIIGLIKLNDLFDCICVFICI